jgi:hypothetical protein
LSSNAYDRGPAGIRLNLVGKPARDITKLKRGKSITVHSHVDVRRVGVQALTYHQAGLAVRIATAVPPLDRRLQIEIAPDTVSTQNERRHW